MITCNLKGGLGNMMFQIAAMKSLSKDNFSEVSFPNLNNHIRILNEEVGHNPKMNYAQEYFNIFKNLSLIQDSVDIKASFELPFGYLKLKFKDNSNYNGFFQSENFFVHNRDFILDIFEPSNDIKEYIEGKYSDVLKLKTCAIHVRRGDYLKLQDTHIVQDIEYYNSGIIEIGEVDKYLVFSDDIEWCKQNFIGDKFLFIEETRDYNELFLMSLCTHQIISNSSFSWWGAWLNKNPDKKVIGPKRWFNESSNWLKQESINSDDILPDNWIKL